MEKKYQIFISSTYVDLIEERKEVIQALLELDCIPVGMELFPAANEDQWTLIKELIDTCDYYLLVVGGRYGSLNDQGISYTQMEYEYAIEKGIPVVAFTPKNPEIIPIGKTDKDSEKAKKLECFLDLVNQKMCKHYEDAKDLGSVASRSIIKLIKKHPAVGWIRANQLTSEESNKEIIKLRNKIEELEQEINQRKNFAPKGSEDLEQGDDKMKVNFIYYDKSWDIGEEHNDGNEEFAWNEIYSRLSPLMVDEANEPTLKTETNIMILDRIKNSQGINPNRVLVNSEDFQTIKIQFVALGLIEKSDKKRSIKDSDTYWKLTPYGEKTMMSLKARRKKNES